VNAERFPELAGREQQAERAAQLLVKAAAAVTALAPDEGWLGQAERLRGAASYARTAADELLVTVGYLEAADAAARAGLLDSEAP
jgi:hypothetical protein